MVDVGAVADFEDGVARVVRVADREIGVVVWDGEPFAVRNVCPHMFAPLAEGVVAPRLCSAGPLSALDADRGAPVLICPWHGWAFDLRSGQVAFGERRAPGAPPFRRRVRRYDARIVAGRVLVDA